MSTSTIAIQRAHHLSHDAAKNAAELALDGLTKKYGIQAQWRGDTLHIDGSGVTGTLEVLPQQLSLNLSLNFMAAMFKGAI
ncbi:MAG: polyhydroxyalkanoic acid system family protein, partial [Spongiibacteraceae bacterium]